MQPDVEMVKSMNQYDSGKNNDGNNMICDCDIVELSEVNSTQVIITTHSANVVKKLDYSNLRLISNSDEGKTVETVLPGQLPYPSLNEVNYLAFSEVSEEYHNELYGYIEAEGQWDAYKAGKPTMPYIKILRGGSTRQDQVVLSEYIRHQIHHPENTHNPHFTEQQLQTSIQLLRDFVQTIV